MKKLALAVLSTLSLTACPMTDGSAPATLEDSTFVQNTELGCLCSAELSVPGPPVKDWGGEVPPPPENGGYVLEPLNEAQSQWLLTVVDVDRGEVTESFLLAKVKDKLNAVNKIGQQQPNYPRSLLAIIGSLRPIPQPGPPGEPGEHYRRALNTLRGIQWAVAGNQHGGHLGKQSNPGPGY